MDIDTTTLQRPDGLHSLGSDCNSGSQERANYIRAAEHGDVDLRLPDFTAGAVDHFGGLSGVVDEALVPGAMLKAHHRLGGVLIERLQT